MKTANADMAAAWDGPEGDHWAEHADRYETVGLGFWPPLAAALRIEVEDDVLDVGCGTGRTTRAAAHVAKRGQVLGVDLSSRMLARARDAAAADELTNVRFEQADAQVHQFEPESFDVVMSNFGAMFFSDPVAAFANIGGAMRAGGRLGLLAWRGFAENEWLTAIREALAAGRDLPLPPAGVPGPFGLADDRRTRTILESAGFVDVALDRVDVPLWFGSDPDDAFAFLSTFGIAKGLLHDLDADASAHATARLRHTITAHHGPGGVTFAGSAWLVRGRWPGRG